jgi:hypothetical protein
MIGDDNRAVSIAITHALTLAITAVLISGLLIGAGQLLDDQEDRAAEEQFSEIGGDVLSHVNSLDRLNATGEQVNATVEPSYPSRVVGESYRINITDDDSSYPFDTPYALVITSDLLEQPKQYPLNTTGPTELDETARVQGGDVLICLQNGEISMGANCT